MPKVISTTEFLRRAIEKHGFRYDYSKVIYSGMQNKIKIICPIHGLFEQTPDNHLRSSGCGRCAYEFSRYSKTRHTREEFIKKAQRVHGTTFDYSQVDYINDGEKVKIICSEHGVFKQTPSAHLQGGGCNKCSQRPKMSTAEFIKKCKDVHEKYDYSGTKFVGFRKNIEVSCPKHGIFEQNSYVHMRGGLCPLCRPRGHSNKSLEWLNYIAEREGINIKHVKNDNEYNIPGTRFFVDGFCEETNTIYEFYGDVFHGNPSKFANDQRCGPSLKTAGELYALTLKRESIITQLGYNLITIWESEWDEIKKTS